MKTVTVKKDELLSVLKVNLDNHIDDYAEAKHLRRKKMIFELQKEIDSFAREDDYEGLTSYQYPVPPNNEDEYRKAITMVEMSVDDEIELTSEEFDRWVMDNWQYKHQFAQTMRSYS